MEVDEIYSKLTELFREFFSNEDIDLTPETSANDIEGWDSFNHISVIVAVETRFNVRMKTNELDKLANIGDLVDSIKKKLEVDEQFHYR